MKQTYTFLLIPLLFLLTQCNTPKTSAENKVENKKVERQLVWSDEFDEAGAPNPQKWGYDKGDGCPQVCGWGNNELQYYTVNRLENARVEDGHLIIEAHKEDFENKNYTSARLVTKDKGDWKYGKIEVRAKLPSGRGTWPAIWMLPTNSPYKGGWPHTGEIDIMEHVGYNVDSLFGTVHTGAYNHIQGTQKGGKLFSTNLETEFHTYGIDWTVDKIDFLYDGKVFFTFKNEEKTFEEWPFDQPFHLLLNLAAGGNWGGSMGMDDSIWPQRMEVDFVRVYQ